MDDLKPIGYMNAGQVDQLRQGLLPYGYVYDATKPHVGADIAVYDADTIARLTQELEACGRTAAANADTIDRLKQEESKLLQISVSLHDEVRIHRALIDRLTQELADMTADRDGWERQASDRVDDVLKMARERDEAREELAACCELKRLYQEREVAALARAEAAEGDARRWRHAVERCFWTLITEEPGILRWSLLIEAGALDAEDAEPESAIDAAIAAEGEHRG